MQDLKILYEDGTHYTKLIYKPWLIIHGLYDLNKVPQVKYLLYDLNTEHRYDVTGEADKIIDYNMEPFKVNGNYLVSLTESVFSS